MEPVLFNDIKRAVNADKVLSLVIKYMKNGWPRKITCKSILPYFQCKTDLEIINNCLFRGHRVVIPTVYRRRMLEELHSAHFGIVKTKSAARSRMWWPGIDADIEQWIGACATCAAVRPAPPRAPPAPPAPWPRPPAPWYRIHIDYMSIGQAVYLIVVDAFSKWLECVHMDRGTSTSVLIQKLKDMFSRFGVPNVIVSDNDVKINSAEFHNFCLLNGIKHITSPIYHPASNGQAENSVKICKKILKCIILECRNHNDVFNNLQNCLFHYRNTIHCATGATPAMLMMGRNLRCRLDLVLPYFNKTENKDQPSQLNPSRCFQVGETVWARWYVARKNIWCLGIITKIIGNRMFQIYFKKYNTACNRHVDQIRKYTANTSVVSETRSDTSPLPTSTPSAVPSPASPSLTARQLSPPPPSPVAPIEHCTPLAEQNVPPISNATETLKATARDGEDRIVLEEDAEEWAEASDVMTEEPRSAESDVLPANEDSNPKNGVNPFRRSRRKREHVNYKSYF